MDALEIEIEEIPTPLLTEENTNDFVNKQLISRLFDTIDGADFEKHLLLSRGIRTPYTTVKTAGRHSNAGETEQYVKKISQHFDQKAIQKMLYMCGFCSYVGGPGFPDLIVLGHEPRLFFTSEDLPSENVLFILLGKLLGIGPIKIIKAVPEEKRRQRTLKILLRGFLSSLVKDKRFRHYLGELDEMIAQEEGRLVTPLDEPQIQQCRDEIAYLGRQKKKMPFFILKTWMESGVRKEDLDEHMGEMDRIFRTEEIGKHSLLTQLATDERFQAMGKGMDQQTLMKKKQYLMDIFHIGTSRAEELLKAVTWA